jgi:hypothetical protein
MKKIFQGLFLTIVLFASCKKENITIASQLTTPCKKDSGFLSSIKNSACSSTSPFKFQVTINGKEICFDRPTNFDTFNVDRWKINYYSNVIYSTRVNADSSLMIGLTYPYPSFKSSLLPFSVHQSYNPCEFVTITISVIKPYDPTVCEPHEKTIWLTTSYTGLTLNCKIISFKDNVIEGVFDGNNISKERDIRVTNGYFNIKLRIEEE